MQKKRPLHTLQNRAQVHDSLRLPYERDLTIGPNGNDVVRDDPLCKNCAKRWFSERIPWLLPTAGCYNGARGFQPAGMYMMLIEGKYILQVCEEVLNLPTAQCSFVIAANHQRLSQDLKHSIKASETVPVSGLHETSDRRYLCAQYQIYVGFPSLRPRLSTSC